ncbi:MAG: hypothetical protein AB8H86_19015 [Polyangiales bacterium]
MRRVSSAWRVFFTLSCLLPASAFADAPAQPNIGRPLLEVQTPAPPDGKRFVLYPFLVYGTDGYQLVELEGRQEIPLVPQNATPTVYLVPSTYAGDGSDLREGSEGALRVGWLLPEVGDPGFGSIRFGEPGARIVSEGGVFKVDQTQATFNWLTLVGVLGMGFFWWSRRRART